MKKIAFLIVVLALFTTSVVFAADPAKPGSKFEQNKAKHLQNLDANIRKDMDLKACFEKSQSPAGMQACKGKSSKGKGAAGPKFANNKAKTIQKIDSRIKQREDRKTCIANAATHADIKTCPKVKSGK